MVRSWSLPRTGNPVRPRCHQRRLGYLNNRYYDPATGVFQSVDPLVASTGDPYLYAGGNPTTLTDPTGLSPWGTGDWLLNMLFGSLVHALIQADYMQKHSDTYAEVSYASFDPNEPVAATGRIDLAVLDPGAIADGPRLLGLNEIRPTAESAEDTLQRRELDIYEGQSTTVKVPYQPEISGSWKTYRDPRAYDAGFDILGIAVHARREGAGIITYDYDMAGGDLDWRDLLPLLRAANQTMREVRDANVAARRADFDAQAPPSKNPAAAYIFGGFVVVGAMFAAPVSAPAALIAGGMALARS